MKALLDDARGGWYTTLKIIEAQVRGWVGHNYVWGCYIEGYGMELTATQ